MSPQINATGIQPQLVVKEKKKKTEFSYWPASSFSFICINVFLTEAGKAGNGGVEKGRRIALMTRFFFYSSCLCQTQDKNNVDFVILVFLWPLISSRNEG